MVFFAALFPTILNAEIAYTHKIDIQSLRMDTIESPDGRMFLNISGSHLSSHGQSGHPEIPVEVIRFLVPENASDFSVQITNTGNLTVLHPDIPLYPVQEPVPINDYSSDMFTYPVADVYGDYNSTFKAEIIGESRLEGQYHIVAVRVYPIAYQASTNSLKICESLDIRLEYTESPSDRMNSPAYDNNGFINIADVVVNPELFENSVQYDNTGIIDIVPKVKKYYIISEDYLLDALNDLATWKRQKGYEVILKDIEDIYGDDRYKVGESTGIVDEAESLRKYLQDEASGESPFFCLLVGDHHTKMPIRKLKHTDDGITDVHGVNGDAYIPTDDYFSDLFCSSWNLYKDNYGIYVDSLTDVGFCPDIYVGRLLCNSADQIKNYISKLILYETNPGRGNASYLDNTSLFVQYDGRSKYQDVLAEMNETFNSVECILDSKISNVNATGYPTGEMMLEKINNCGYASLMGHGEPSTIACSGRFHHGKEWEYIKALNEYSYETGQTQIDRPLYSQNSGLDKMSNEDSPSVIYTLACTTEPFDIYDDGFRFDLPHTMASSYTVGGNYGGVAYLGNTRAGYWPRSPEQEKLFLQTIRVYGKIGIAEAMSKYLYDAHDYAGYYVKHGHNLIGDPEFEMWTGKPNVLNIDLNFGSGGCGVSGRDLFGCKVVQYDGTGGLKITDCNKEYISYFFSYLNDNNRFESIGVYRRGYLPVVTLACENQILTNCNKRFVVRDASLGMSTLVTDNLEIGSDANVSVRTIDKAQCGRSLRITGGGCLSINSDKTAYITGSTVSSGGVLEVKAESVMLSPGFKVDRGGRISINKK